MIFTETKLKGAFEIDLEKRGDERGFFARVFCEKEFAAHGLETNFVNANTSRSADKYTLRGFHYQVGDAAEVKVIRCTQGSLIDTIIDIRPDSPTYCQHISVKLTADNHKMLYVPKGFAHSFITLEEDTEAFYFVSNFYSAEDERGIRWNDPLFNVQWPTDNPVLSDKDANHADFVK